MITDHLKQLILARPFKPFVICMTDGKELSVNHPEFIAISPGGSTAVVFIGDEVAEIIPSVQVTRLRTETKPTVPGHA